MVSNPNQRNSLMANTMVSYDVAPYLNVPKVLHSSKIRSSDFFANAALMISHEFNPDYS
jgi:hypothetical protein